MGEFEQAKPIIELIKENYKGIEIIASFYSPSGLENQLNYNYVDYFLYLPFDSRAKIKSFFDRVSPDLVVIVRYEFWFNFIDEIRKRGLKSIMVGATQPNSNYATNPISKPYFLDTINKIGTIYSNDDRSFNFYKGIYNNELVNSFDPRFDRINKRVIEASKNEIIRKERFENKFVIILGSSWGEDENIFLDMRIMENHKLRLIFVPHEPTETHIMELNKKLGKSILLSEALKNEEIIDEHLIVDSIGKLLSLYSIADAAYIGGGFGAGVHSVTEPAGYGLALATGPKMNNSPDAVELERQGVLKVIQNSDGLTDWIDNTLFDEDKRLNIEKGAKDYINSRLGSSKLVYEEIRIFLER